MIISQIQEMSPQILIAVLFVAVLINILITLVLLKRVKSIKTTGSREDSNAGTDYDAAPGRQNAVTADSDDEIAAAISIALHLSKEGIHDYESAVLTINKVAKTYSPWSSKLYGIRKNPK